jgi:tetratricopeptide (TPR) repeat protein
MQYINGQSLAQVIDETRCRSAARSQRTTRAEAGDGLTKRIAREGTASGGRGSLEDWQYFRTVARLGREAAEALAHAHEFGIIHRDIKPSNLLVDTLGHLWVTDFGLARMQTNACVTLTGDVVGTLRYMSPEQAAGHTALVDARTDVYSLGATLYELLAGQPAFDDEDRQGLLRRVISDEPLPPHKLNRAIPPDLETIVLTAMAKAREERYPSAAALAEDLERFLDDKPTLARRPTVADRAARWARRHRPLVTVVVCAMMLVSVVSAAGLALVVREQARTSAALAQAQHSAQAARDSFARAERHFQQARGVVDQFGVGLVDRLAEIPGAESVRRELLLDSLRYYRQFAAEAGADPQLRRELAVAHFKSGMLAAKLGAARDALAEYQAAQSLFEALAQPPAATAESRSQLAMTHNNLGLLLAAQGDVEAARERYARAIALQRRLVEQHPSQPEFASQLAETQANLGMLLDQMGHQQRAEQALRLAVDVLRPLGASVTAEARHARSLAIACNNLSFVLRKRDAAAAEQAVLEAIAIARQLGQRFPTRTQYQDDLALCYNNLAAIAGGRDRLDEAIRWHEEAIAVRESLVRKSPAVVRHRSELATSLNNLGVVYCKAEQPGKADAAFQRARDLLATLAKDYPAELAYRSSLAALLNNQALALAGANRHQEALPLYAQAVELERGGPRPRYASAVSREVLSKMYFNYGKSFCAIGRLRAAVEAALARRELWHDDGERLLGVAVELAEIAELARDAPPGATDLGDARTLDDEIIATLARARKRGWRGAGDLADDERFAFLRTNADFAALVAETHSETGGASASRAP